VTGYQPEGWGLSRTNRLSAHLLDLTIERIPEKCNESFHIPHRVQKTALKH
jgi:hypothetical protein